MAKPGGEIIAFCPKCNKSIDDQNPYAWCVECGEPLPPEVKAKIPLLVEQEQQAKEKEQTPRYNYQKIADDWPLKSNEQLIEAAERLSTFTALEEEKIRAELRRRSMPEPGPTVRTAQPIDLSSEDVDASSARAKLKGPSIAIIVNAGLLLFSFLIVIFLQNTTSNRYQHEEYLRHEEFWIFMLVLVFCASAFSLYGALEMMNSRKYSIAIVISIIAILSVCQTLIGLPIGIWALVVLMKPDIKSAFVS